MLTLFAGFVVSTVSSHAAENANPSLDPTYYNPTPFGTDTRWAKDSDNVATGQWWKPVPRESKRQKPMREWFRTIPRSQAVAFALYTHDNGVLKISGQCFPLLPTEPKAVTLELQKEGKWVKVDKQSVVYPGWSVHFRVEDWDNTRDVPYRLRLGKVSQFEGLIRKNPTEKDVLVVASMSCNSPKDKERFTRTQFINNLKKQDPDLLFFAGDQNYVHDEATFGWLQFGMQFRDLMKDRPTICILDDHDIGHGNLWGQGGAKSSGNGGSADGGDRVPASLVHLVDRQPP